MSGVTASVLVVDDNKAKRGALVAALAPLGLEVVEAGNGRAGLRALLGREFAVVLLDINLPDMDGYEVAELLRARPKSAHTPILYVTAERETDIDRRRGYSTGAVDFILAPVMPEVLRSKVSVFVELYRMRREALDMAERLERASRMKSDFLASMSHELRTPLNAIIGFSELLKDGLAGKLSEEQREFVGDIYASGQHLLSLINDILDLSKVEAGKMTLALEPVALRPLFANGLTVVKEKALAHRIRLELTAGEEIGEIGADARKLKQIVFNLLSNAVKFTPDGGRVVLAARRVPRAEVARPRADGIAQVAFPPAESAHAEFLEVSVADSGIGISRQGLEHLFQSFVQLDSKLSRRFEGTGLGLSLVKQLVELHGGAVACASEEGKGALVTFWIPWRPAAAPAANHALAAPRAVPEVLVVEDDAAAAKLMRAALEAAGYAVRVAASGERALEFARERAPDVVTLDLGLPGISGWDLLGLMKEESALHGVPVVIVSAQPDLRRGFALGACAVLEKPVSRERLVAALAAAGLACGAGTACRVLIVDDEPKILQLVARNLKHAGFRVDTAGGGREAIEKVLAQPPDALVLDLMMPEMSGFDVVQTMKGRDSTREIPIVVLTALRLSPKERKTLEQDVVRVIEKSEFSACDLVSEVRRALRAYPRRGN